MIEVTIPEERLIYDEEENRFYRIPPQTVELEYSLISVSKWESKWKIPFFSFFSNPKRYPNNYDKRFDMETDFFRCMVIGKHVNDKIAYAFTQEDRNRIKDYMNDTMSATKFYHWNNRKGASSRQDLTSERIYAVMVRLGMQIDVFEKWHLNRLFNVIEACSDSEEDKHTLTAAEMNAINKARRRKYHTKG